MSASINDCCFSQLSCTILVRVTVMHFMHERSLTTVMIARVQVNISHYSSTDVTADKKQLLCLSATSAPTTSTIAPNYSYSVHPTQTHG